MNVAVRSFASLAGSTFPGSRLPFPDAGFCIVASRFEDAVLTGLAFAAERARTPTWFFVATLVRFSMTVPLLE
ncbi:MAG: hypothetical protein IPH26_01930 [Sterolibacteriaceae bacterium]|uniref:Uncharacterized protein n=1 Tax=Candidatus Methylophosphatis roskildensis TaxID=2899263 RepID=A0A9D7HPX7_9PROT|nr:hypothetical protein [Candidatus Methylophosphatis roskildensis]MBK7234166.1 hypothetical protein [Sterolibacteriaceae bacterium]